MSRSTGLGEERVDLRDRRRTFTDGAADALHRPRAHIADREHSRHAALERRAAMARGHKALVVEGDWTVAQPPGSGIRAEKQKHVIHGTCLRRVSVAIPPGHGLDTR